MILRGIDRIQYGSYAELQEGLAKLLAQELPVKPAHDVENQLDLLRGQALKLITESEGLTVADIAKLLGMSIDMAKLVIYPMVNDKLEMKAKTRVPKTGESHTSSAASIQMFGSDDKIIWSAP